MYLRSAEERWNQRIAFETIRRPSLPLPCHSQPVVHFLANLVTGISIAILNPSLQLFPASIDHGQVVVGQLAPLFLDLAFEFFPAAFDTIPIHHLPPPFWQS